MTKTKGNRRAALPTGIFGAVLSVGALVLTALVSVYLSPKTKSLVEAALKMCGGEVVPAVFPFLILADLYIAVGYPERIPLLPSVFRAVYGIERAGVRALISGALSGFPVGVRATAELYRGGLISRESAERLIALSNIPSPAFVTAAVGLGMFGSAEVGRILLLSVLLSSPICALIFRGKGAKEDNVGNISGQKFDIVESIRNAGLGTVSICAFVVSFATVAGIASEYLSGLSIFPFIVSVLEVTGAASYFAAESAKIGAYAAIFGSAFSLGFGGLSVMLQSAVFLRGTDISMKKYIPIKLTEGLLSGVFALLFYSMTK